MNKDFHDFKAFMKQRESAASAYVAGNEKLVNEIVASHSPATFFGPSGNYKQGAEEVAYDYRQGAAHFAPGGESYFEIFQMGSSNEYAFWVGIQHAKTRAKGKDEIDPQDLRVTEIFRFENGDWKMIHRHADILKD
jgi:ketosteroid isomerase-like protein